MRFIFKTHLRAASSCLFVLNIEAFVGRNQVSLTGNTDPFKTYNERDENIKEDRRRGRFKKGLWLKINMRLIMIP